MKVLKPYYYDEFECIADKCKDSCCIGWEINIDKEAFKEYQKVPGSFNKRLNNNITINEKSDDDFDYGRMNLTKERRCTFLNSENLCDLYINIGEDYLCNTCKLYPRTIYKYTDILERNLMLSCPEVARIFVNIKGKFAFDMEEEELSKLDLYNTKYYFDKKVIYDLFWKSRSFLIDIAQFEEIEIWKRLWLIKLCSDEIQKVIDDKRFSEIDNVIEHLTVKITDEGFLKSLDSIKSDDKAKSLFINLIIDLRKRFDISNKIFMDLLTEFKNIEKEAAGNFEILHNIEIDFDQYFKDRENILENFIVYNLYKNCMENIKAEKLSDSILLTIVMYSLLKQLLVVKWYKNNQKLSDEGIIDVIYSFSRMMENIQDYMNILITQIKECGCDSLKHLAILVR